MKDSGLEEMLGFFRNAMHDKLSWKEKEGREGWEDEDIPNLYSALREEVKELGAAIGKSLPEIKREAVDIANFALFIWAVAAYEEEYGD